MEKAYTSSVQLHTFFIHLCMYAYIYIYIYKEKQVSDNDYLTTCVTQVALLLWLFLYSGFRKFLFYYILLNCNNLIENQNVIYQISSVIIFDKVH